MTEIQGSYRVWACKAICHIRGDYRALRPNPSHVPGSSMHVHDQGIACFNVLPKDSVRLAITTVGAASILGHQLRRVKPHRTSKMRGLALPTFTTTE